MKKRTGDAWPFFNVFNHAESDKPGTNLGLPPTFGMITTTAPSRIIQFAARFTF
jgi:hypothetical protein